MWLRGRALDRNISPLGYRLVRIAERGEPCGIEFGYRFLFYALLLLISLDYLA